MENIFEKSLLYDFYGELLTDHQKKIYEDVVINDLSFGEIAAEEGISRQGVHDLIKRCNKILADYENKLKLVDKFMAVKGYVRDIQDKCLEYNKNNLNIELVENTEKNDNKNANKNNNRLIKEIEEISKEILDVL